LRRIKTASIEVTIDFPTPPLPLATAITFFILESSFCFSRKDALSLFPQPFSPQEEQLLLQLDIL
jgi:hypothetical protein